MGKTPKMDCPLPFFMSGGEAALLICPTTFKFSWVVMTPAGIRGIRGAGMSFQAEMSRHPRPYLLRDRSTEETDDSRVNKSSGRCENRTYSSTAVTQHRTIIVIPLLQLHAAKVPHFGLARKDGIVRVDALGLFLERGGDAVARKSPEYFGDLVSFFLQNVDGADVGFEDCLRGEG